MLQQASLFPAHDFVWFVRAASQPPALAFLFIQKTMAAMKGQLPGIDELPSLTTVERASVLDLLFEPSPQLHTLTVELLKTQSFSSYNDLIAAVGVQLTELAESTSSSDTKWLESILESHPRLGAKKVESAQSQAEQANLQKGNEAEVEQLQKLNEEYEAAYPGLRYVVFVNGRERPAIMEDMKHRIGQGDIRSERLAAIKVVSVSLCHSDLSTKEIQAMCEIAADRATKLMA